MTSRLRLCLSIALALVVALGILLSSWPFLSFAIAWVYPGYFCETQSRGSVRGVAGYDFEISETACDTLAKDDAITVFASDSTTKERTAILKYDPGGDEIPEISAVDAHAVRISLRSVSSIFFRKDAVGTLSISYDIVHIDYPQGATSKRDER